MIFAAGREIRKPGMFGIIDNWFRCWLALSVGDAADVYGLTPSSGAEALRFMTTPKVTQAQAFGQPLGRLPPISGHEKIPPHLSDVDAYPRVSFLRGNRSEKEPLKLEG